MFTEEGCLKYLLFKLKEVLISGGLIQHSGTYLRACSHGGGGPQVGEAPHLPVVKESWLSHAIFTTPGWWGEVSKCFCSVITFFVIRARSLSSWLFKVTVHFIQGLFGLSEPFKAKFIEEINR